MNRQEHRASECKETRFKGAVSKDIISRFRLRAFLRRLRKETVARPLLLTTANSKLI